MNKELTAAEIEAVLLADKGSDGIGRREAQAQPYRVGRDQAVCQGSNMISRYAPWTDEDYDVYETLMLKTRGGGVLRMIASERKEKIHLGHHARIARERILLKHHAREENNISTVY